MLRGLLCDLDGTLADSEPLHCSAWLDLLSEEYGCDYDEHWFEQWIGTSDRVVSHYLVGEHDWDVPSITLVDQKQRRFHDNVRRSGKTFAGVPEMLGRIAGRFPLAIATNSGRADADLMIASTGLDRFTDISVTASDVEHMKPEPDIYLLAAKRAGCYLIGLTDKVTQADEMADTNEAALERAYALLDGADR